MSMIGSNDKLKQAAAGAGGGPGLNVEEVFSTYLYEGNGATTHTITNGIDLDGEGGLVWVKRRDAGGDHNLTDTERGTGNVLNTAGNGGSANFLTYSVKAFNSNGFSVGSHPTQSASINYSGDDYASWTFRKAPKFFDVVTWTGDGSGAGFQTINHSLGVVPGFIVVKATSATNTWFSYHRSLGVNSWVSLNATQAVQTNANANWNPTQTTFEADNFFGINSTGVSYVAYLFAHNDGDGDFGPNGDADIIKCGSYTGNGSSDGPEIDLGFEPQWLLVKRASGGTSPWQLLDTMRGFTSGSFGDKELQPNASNAENEDERITLLSTGFKPVVSTNEYNASGNTYIYIAIRRGPLVAPEDEEDLFYIQSWSPNGTNPQSVTVAGNKNFIPDFLLVKPKTTANNWLASSRLTGGEYLNTNTDAAATSTTIDWGVRNHYGYLELGSPFNISSYGQNTSYVWSRAPGFFDVITWEGTGSSGRTLSHNLGTEPALWITKARENTSFQEWWVGSTAVGSNATLDLNLPYAQQAQFNNSVWNNTLPTSTELYLGNYNFTNRSGINYIGYIFGSLLGVSKVGSYTGNGSSQTIDCGFTSGARFILIKRTDSSGDWYVWDHRFGITSGDESHFSLNTNAIQSTADDSVDPNSSGFIVNQVSATNINVSSATYIFYAIA